MDHCDGDIHETARSWYLAKIINGEQPQVVDGGMLDGLKYYAIELDGVHYWLTEAGLFDPTLADGQKID